MIGRVLVRFVAVASIAVCVVVALVDALRGWPSGGFYAIDSAGITTCRCSAGSGCVAAVPIAA